MGTSPEGNFRNVAISFRVGDQPIVRGQVDKKWPAIVGETPIGRDNPLENIGDWIFGEHGELQPRQTGRCLPFGRTNACTAICSEHMMPNVFDAADIHRCNLILVIADTRWFEYSHTERLLSRSGRRLLAERYGKPLLYCANGGSELISPKGDLVQQMAPDVDGRTWRLNKSTLFYSDIPATW